MQSGHRNRSKLDWREEVPSDYEAIRRENIARYGTDIDRIGPMLLANRYDDQTHFIFEVLQNAEDALGRCESPPKDTTVRFRLTEQELTIEHFGTPFTESDVRGVCGIAESTKDELTAIGRFGIGFKSVYSFTDSPEIHSGEEHFCIRSYVRPEAVAVPSMTAGATLLRIPFKDGDGNAWQEVARGLQKLEPSTLLFLRNVDSISWLLPNGRTDGLTRTVTPVAPGVDRVNVERRSSLHGRTLESWELHSRDVRWKDQNIGRVELAFQLTDEQIVPVENPKLVVFFPTVLKTSLGFLVQGPYRTTPSRDNVPRNDELNKHLVEQTGVLLLEALRFLRDRGRLDVDVLCTLPLDRAAFSEGELMAPLFDIVASALSEEDLIPCDPGCYASSSKCRVPETGAIRELLSPEQLGTMLGEPGRVQWVTELVTSNRAPLAHAYLRSELEVEEIGLRRIIAALDQQFLEAQSDDWIARLYAFLSDKQRSLSQLVHRPIVRLEDGSHVYANLDGVAQAYLPSHERTDFPTVHADVCRSDEALTFLSVLGLRRPDLVADVVRNVLPRYVEGAPPPDDYEQDIRRILNASETDSDTRRKAFYDALTSAPFVAVRPPDGSTPVLAKPENVYLPTERLLRLFEGIDAVSFLEHTIPCLQETDTQRFLERCGVARNLQPEPVPCKLLPEELSALRKAHGQSRFSRLKGSDDFNLRGLEELLEALPELDYAEQAARAEMLWDALGSLYERNRSAFVGTHRWFFGRDVSCEFDAEFLRWLNERAWIPDPNLGLVAPSEVFFKDTGWTEHPFLQAKIHFKPPILSQLAQEAGIDLGLLTLLKELGLTSADELKSRLGESDGSSTLGTQEPAHDTPFGHQTPGTRPEWQGDSSRSSGSAAGGGGAVGQVDDSSGDGRAKTGAQREFVSYVGVHLEDADHAANAAGQQERLRLEELAIEHILEQEPQLARTPTNNPGFDLFEEDGEVISRWIEVKAMAGTLGEHPVGLSRTQFATATHHGANYWLYVVERAGSQRPNVLRIQNPAGRANTFTFDRGWVHAAEVNNSAAPSWEEMLELVDETFRQHLLAIQNSGAPPPSDVHCALTAEGRTTGFEAIAVWDISDRRLALVDSHAIHGLQSADEELLVVGLPGWRERLLAKVQFRD